MTARFVGDPTGYVLCQPLSQPPQEGDPGPQWMQAFVGRTTRKVWIDLSKAYLIEETRR